MGLLLRVAAGLNEQTNSRDLAGRNKWMGGNEPRNSRAQIHMRLNGGSNLKNCEVSFKKFVMSDALAREDHFGHCPGRPQVF
jgi:hypothetical protein